MRKGLADRQLIEVLTSRLEALELENRALRLQVGELKERLASYENPKNSRNSSIPPSKDENRPKKNQSLRKKSGKRPGGQPGHKGNTLKKTDHPDIVIDLQPGFCRNCGSSLEDSPAIEGKSRQVVDIPPIKAVWTQYRAHGKQCACGCLTVADFPGEAGSPVSYGNNIEGLIGYFHSRQYLPFARMKEMMGNVFNIDISEGGIHCLLKRFAQKTTPMYETIRQRVAASKVIGTDETGAKVNGDKHWFWTWQTPELTYIAHCGTRGKAAIDANFPQGFPGAVLVRDGWRAQAATIAEHHQLCLPHLLRNLNYLNGKYTGAKWGKSFMALLNDAIELNKSGVVENHNTERAKIVARLQWLLERPPDKRHKELHIFYKRVCRERQCLFVFLFINDVPSDNNASERAIRNVKVKQKISGQFKTAKTAQNFAKIRSVIDTTLKNGMNVVDALTLIAKSQPRLAD